LKALEKVGWTKEMYVGGVRALGRIEKGNMKKELERRNSDQGL
jgi:hypothetical protein